MSKVLSHQEVCTYLGMELDERGKSREAVLSSKFTESRVSTRYALSSGIRTSLNRARRVLSCLVTIRAVVDHAFIACQFRTSSKTISCSSIVHSCLAALIISLAAHILSELPL